MSEAVNITKLAREFHATTPNIRKRLEKLGVNPIQEIEMPSGRKFVLFDKAEAFAVLHQERKARDAAIQAAFNQEPVAAPAPADCASEDDVKRLQTEVTELKSLMQQILDTLTAPKKG